MNYFVEGLQGSGKSTMVRKLSERNPGAIAVLEGDYSPVELAWCARMDAEKYREILEKYAEIRPQIEEKTVVEGDRYVVCYTQIRTEIPGFYQDLEQYEIYNGRISWEEFRAIVLGRDRHFSGDRMIFECSLFQNIVEDMILFRCASDEEILNFYREIREALAGTEYRIVYLAAENLRENLEVIRKERSDPEGNELWFPVMIGYFNDSPYAKKAGASGEEALIRHFEHRQALELRIIRELFPDRSVVLTSKKYTEADLERVDRE